MSAEKAIIGSRALRPCSHNRMPERSDSVQGGFKTRLFKAFLKKGGNLKVALNISTSTVCIY